MLHEGAVTAIRALAVLLAWAIGLLMIGAGFHAAEKFAAWRRARQLDRHTRPEDRSGD